MKKYLSLFLFILIVLVVNSPGIIAGNTNDPVYQDVPFLQDYSVKYYNNQPGNRLIKAFSDRNGVIQILSSNGLSKPAGGAFLYPGTIEPDGTYRSMSGKKLVSMSVYQNQFVYLDDEAVLSNAWAGKLFSKHGQNHIWLALSGQRLSLRQTNRIRSC